MRDESPGYRTYLEETTVPALRDRAIGLTLPHARTFAQSMETMVTSGRRRDAKWFRLDVR